MVKLILNLAIEAYGDILPPEFLLHPRHFVFCGLAFGLVARRFGGIAYGRQQTSEAEKQDE
ncbi:MAG: hypothetical protein GX174_14565 [Lentisphaerae bacterium]|nr:hypothetical protein [Lentisphaerota bacterium]